MGLLLIISVLNFSMLDWLIIAILVYSIVSSAIQGFVRETLGLATVLVAALLAAWFYRGVATLFKDVVRTENLALFFGFSLIFVGTLVVGLLITWLVTRFMKFAKLEWADRLLGAAFGLIRGWVIGAVLLLGLTAFEVQTERLKNSELAPYFLPGSRVIAVLTPYELKAKFLVGYRVMERWWREH
ncbi:MAG: colicin V production protein [Acidobacteria bacterium]|nr:MAG: colicin V production protein [Acidobacteriota bacterium]